MDLDHHLGRFRSSSAGHEAHEAWPMMTQESRDWYKKRAKELKDQGCLSYRPDQNNLPPIVRTNFVSKLQRANDRFRMEQSLGIGEDSIHGLGLDPDEHWLQVYDEFFP